MLAALSLAAAIVCAASAAAAGPQVDLLKTFKAQLAQIKQKSTVPVLLPRSLPLLDKLKLYPSGGGDTAGWDLELASRRNCGSAPPASLPRSRARRARSCPAR